MTKHRTAASEGPARRYRTSGDRKPRGERWSEILDVAAQVFSEKGYDATTLQEIATRTGILKGSIYYYINTKGDLLAHLLREAHETGLKNIRPIAEGAGDPVERLEAMIRAHIEYVCTDRARTAVFAHERKRLTEEQRKEFFGDEHAYRHLFQRMIKEGQDQGLIQPNLDSKLAAMCMLGSLNSLYQWYRPNGEFSKRKIADHFVAATLTGIKMNALSSALPKSGRSKNA